MKFLNGQLQLDSSITGTTALFTSGLTVGSGQTSSSGIARGQLLNSNLTASANNDVLVGLDINPAFTNGAFTGITNASLRTRGWIWANTGIVLGDNTGVSWNSGAPLNGFQIFPGGTYYVGSGAGFRHSFRTNANSSGGERLRITDDFTSVLNGNLLVGTTTDAGYKLDVNGTTRIRGAGSTSSTTSLLVQNSAQTSFLTVYDNGAVNIGSTNPGIYTTFGYSGRIGNNMFESPSAIYRYGSGQLTFYGTNNNANAFSFEHNNQQSSTSTGISMINLGGGYQNQQSFQFSNLQIAPTYDFNTNTTSAAIARGIYYNPTITNLRVAQHRAIETVTGDVILGSTSGNVGIGTSTLGTSTELTVGGGQSASSAIARGQLLNTTLTATSNNDVLVGLDVAPTFTNGAFTGVTNLALRVAYSSSRFISFTQRPGYADYGRIQFTNVSGADIYSSSRIDLLPNDTSQSVGLGNNITSQRLAGSTNWGLYGQTASGFLVGANAAFGVLSNNSDGNTDSFVFAGPTGSRHFFKVVQNDVPYFTIVPTGNVLINTTTAVSYTHLTLPTKRIV